MTLASDLGYQVREDDLVRTDLYNADEVFFTGTAAEIADREVDDRLVGEGHRGPIAKELQGAFFAATKGENEKRGLADLRERLIVAVRAEVSDTRYRLPRGAVPTRTTWSGAGPRGGHVRRLG